MRVCISYQDTVNGSFGRGNLRGNFFLLYYYKVRVRRVATRVAPTKALQEVRGKNPPVTTLPGWGPLGKGPRGREDGLPRALCALAMTPLQGVPLAGRCGERTERCQRQKKQSERVAAVKILSVRRKAAQKFWAPQQDHRPLRKRIMGCVGEGLCPSRGRGRTPPLRKRYKGCSGERNPPVTASPCQPPLGKGAMGTGVRIATTSLRTGLAMTHYKERGAWSAAG